MRRLESQEEVIDQTKNEPEDPRHRNVQGSRVIEDVSCSITELQADESFRETHEEGDPSEFAANRIGDSRFLAPSIDICVKFLECHAGEEEPHHESVNVNPISRRNPQRVDHEEAAQEVENDDHPNHEHASKSSVAFPHFPVKESLWSFAAKPVVWLHFEFLHQPQTYFQDIQKINKPN